MSVLFGDLLSQSYNITFSMFLYLVYRDSLAFVRCLHGAHAPSDELSSSPIDQEAHQASKEPSAVWTQWLLPEVGFRVPLKPRLHETLNLGWNPS